MAAAQRAGAAARSCGRRPAGAQPGYTVANVCWWYAMGADVDWTVTPRPIYHADGRKEPDCYTDPPELHDELTGALGTFPLFTYWGPGAGLASSRWICRAAAADPGRRTRPDLTLVYVPHLDYDLQRFGPSSPRGRRGGGRAGRACSARCSTPRAAPGRDRGGAVRVRHHRRSPAGRRQPAAARRGAAAGAHPGRHGVPGPVDVAGVRGRRPPGRPRLRPRPGRRAGGARSCCAGLPGVGRGARRAPARPRTGSTTRAPASWCWSPSRTPGSPTTTGSTTPARPTSPGCVEIHRKPGYDPAELFFDPAAPGRGQAPGRRSRWPARSSACAT